MIHFGSYKLCDDSFSAATVLWNNTRKIHQFWSVSIGGYLECTDLNMEFCGLLPPEKVVKTHKSHPPRKPIPQNVTLGADGSDQNKVDMKVIEELQPMLPKRGLQPQKRPPRVTSKDETKWGSATPDPLPGQWKPLSMSGSIIPCTLINYLVDAVSKRSTQGFDKDVLLKWFADKEIKTCGDLAAADKDLWKGLAEIVPQSIYNSIEYMIDQVKKTNPQQERKIDTVHAPPPPSTGNKWGARASAHGAAERKQFLGSYTKK